MGNLEDEIRAEKIKNTTGAYARFTSIDGIGQKTAEKLRGLRGVETPSDIEGESAESLADRAGISERRAAKAIRGGGGNAQVRSREARQRAERPPNYFTQIDELSREQADEFGDFFGDPRRAGQFRAEDVQSMMGVDRQTAETVVLASGGDPDEVADRQQDMTAAALDPDERGVTPKRRDFPGAAGTELLTEPKNEYISESGEYVRGFALDDAPQLIGPESERTAPSDGGGQADTGTGQATQASDGALTDISGIGPKTAENLRQQGIDSKDELLRRYRADDPAGGITVDLDLNRRVRRGIREELTDRGERFEDPEANVEVGPENRKAFEVFGETTVSDLDSVDTRAAPVSGDTSIASLAPKAARGALGSRYSRDLTDFGVDAAVNLGLTEMSAARAQEMNARGTNPTAARLGAPRPEDPYGVSVADEPPADRTNPERLEPNDPAVRTDGPPGPLLTVNLSDEEADAATRTLSLAESPAGTDADLSRDKVEDTLFDIKDAQEEDRPAELSPDQAVLLADAVSARVEDDRDFSRTVEDFEGVQDVAAGADPRTDARSEQVSLALSPTFDAEPAVSLFDTDRSSDDGDTDGLFAFDEFGPTSRRPVDEAERQEMEQFGGRDKRSLPGTGLAPSDPEFSDRNERQSRRDRNEPPDDLGEQLAAQQAMPSLVRPSATPAVQLSDVEGRGRDTGGRTDETVSIGPRGTEEIDPGVGGFSVADDTSAGSTTLRDDQGREVTVSRRQTGLHNRRKSFGVSMQKEKGRSLGNETVSERVSFGSYADQGVEGAADEVESIIEEFGSSRFAMDASERQMQFDAEPPVSLSGPRSGGEQRESAPTGSESLEDPDLIRLKSSGRFNRDPTVDEPAAPGQRAPANGRFVGDPDNITRPADPEAPIMRDPDTGQFVAPETAQTETAGLDAMGERAVQTSPFDPGGDLR